jgi:hypothetical protein
VRAVLLELLCQPVVLAHGHISSVGSVICLTHPMRLV